MRPDERREAYNADITYATNNELGFDYLRDNMANALDAVVQGVRHVVAQVVEAQLVIRRVGDIRVVGLAALVGAHLRKDHADGEAQELVDPAHPLGVVPGEVVVDRDDVDALAGPVSYTHLRAHETDSYL